MGEFHRLMTDDHTTVRLYMDAIKRMGELNPDLRREALAELMCFLMARDSALGRTEVGGRSMTEDHGFGERECYHAILPRLLAMDPSDACWRAMFDVIHTKVESALMAEEMMVPLWRVSPQAEALACEFYLEQRETILQRLRKSLERSLPTSSRFVDHDLARHRPAHTAAMA